MIEPDKPNYLNKKLKKVSKEYLKNVLHEMHLKHEADRRQAQKDLNEALNSGFRCM